MIIYKQASIRYKVFALILGAFGFRAIAATRSPDFVDSIDGVPVPPGGIKYMEGKPFEVFSKIRIQRAASQHTAAYQGEQVSPHHLRHLQPDDRIVHIGYGLFDQARD